MYYPTLSSPEVFRESVDTFGGYNRNLRIGAGEFSDMRNLTSDFWPILAPRQPRKLHATYPSAQGLIAKDTLCCVDGTRFVMNGLPIDIGLSTRKADCPKQLVSMGPYVVIFPDKKYINTADVTDYGSLENRFVSGDNVTLAPCDRDGTPIGSVAIHDFVPANPTNGQYWIDTSATPHTMKQWSSTTEMWVGLPQTYVRISAPGIGAGFREFDGVTISGLADAGAVALNGSNVIWKKSDNYLVVSGILEASSLQVRSVTVARSVPDMDYVIECENRLWGCRYGIGSSGSVINELYACKLGDFRNWNCYMGTASDSYTVSLGSDGAFTGAITHMGYPLFFKENCLHKVYGNYPSNYRLQTTPCRGVQRGSHQSLAIVGETLCYKSATGICAFDGSLPTEISGPLGRDRYRNAAAGAIGSKYYISMEDVDTGEYCLFVYDFARRMWHREDNLHAWTMCPCRDSLYALESGTGRLLILTGPAAAGAAEQVGWMAQTGLIGGSTPDAKYLTGLTVRMGLNPGSQVRFSLRYDSASDWESAGEIVSHSLNSFSIPIRPRRCDHLQLKLEGTGDARVYAITRTLEQGSDYF